MPPPDFKPNLPEGLTLPPMSAEMPDASIANDVHLSQFSDKTQHIEIQDPDAPMPPIMLTPCQMFVRAESSCGAIKAYNPSEVNPLVEDTFGADLLAGRIEFGSWKFSNGSLSDLAIVLPDERALISVLFFPPYCSPCLSLPIHFAR